MLPKSQRLSREADIERVLVRGKRIFGQFVTIRVLSTSSESTRAGFIVSKKVHNKPVKRNLVKRRLRSIVSGLLPQFLQKIDLLISAKPQAVTRSYKQLRDEIIDLLIKNRIISITKKNA